MWRSEWNVTPPGSPSDRHRPVKARLTAEGALRLALEQGSLLGKACVVIGYGRIGRLLACLLWRMGAQVTVAARKAADRAMAEALGLRAVCPGDGLPETTALVFNTAPAQALPVAELAALADPPVGKSGMNHRLKKLREIAENLS